MLLIGLLVEAKKIDRWEEGDGGLDSTGDPVGRLPPGSWSVLLVVLADRGYPAS
ncbi:hypothetical protein [Nesterenkonia pannonica]|uniref:hypothetical protein n=1 Tax=Nesterenkonia pannonica TaxID=1548602 RepID=UPI0021645CCC|nr:hypothetical protein [Nesterenkonia pannonica]